MPTGVYPRPIRKPVTVIGPSIAYVPLTRGLFALIDNEDAERIGAAGWMAAWSDHGFYAIRFVGRDRFPLHRFILGDKPGCTVDHKNPHHTLDCRKANLRHANAYQQGMNRRRRRDNKSGHKCVFLRENGRYQAYINAFGKRKVLGCFATAEEAADAYRASALEIHGDFANFG